MHDNYKAVTYKMIHLNVVMIEQNLLQSSVGSSRCVAELTGNTKHRVWSMGNYVMRYDGHDVMEHRIMGLEMIVVHQVLREVVMELSLICFL